MTLTNRQMKRLDRQHDKAVRAWVRRRQNGRKHEPKPRHPLTVPQTTREAFAKPVQQVSEWLLRIPFPLSARI